MLLKYQNLVFLQYTDEADFLLNFQKQLFASGSSDNILITSVGGSDLYNLIYIPLTDLSNNSLRDEIPNYRLIANQQTPSRLGSSFYNLTITTQNIVCIPNNVTNGNTTSGQFNAPTSTNHLIFFYKNTSPALGTVLKNSLNTSPIVDISLNGIFTIDPNNPNKVIYTKVSKNISGNTSELSFSSTGISTMYEVVTTVGSLTDGQIRPLDGSGNPTVNWNSVVQIEIHEKTIQGRINYNLLQMARFQKYTIRNLLRENVPDEGYVAFQVDNVSFSVDKFVIDVLGSVVNLNNFNWNTGSSAVTLDLIGPLLEDLGNLNLSNPQTDQVLSYNGSEWIAVDPPGGAVAIPNDQIAYGNGTSITSSNVFRFGEDDMTLQLGSDVFDGGQSVYVDGVACLNIVAVPNATVPQQPNHTDQRHQLYVEEPANINELTRIKLDAQIVSYLGDLANYHNLSGNATNQGLSEFVVGSTADPTPIRVVVNGLTKFQASQTDTFIGNEAQTNSISISAKDNLFVYGENAGNTQFNLYDVKNVSVHPTEKLQLYGDTNGVVFEINDGAPSSNIYYNSSILTPAQISERVRDNTNPNIIPTRQYVVDTIADENEFLVNMNGNTTTGLGLTEMLIGSTDQSIPVKIIENGAMVADFKNDAVLIQSSDNMALECPGTLTFYGNTATSSVISFGDEDIGKPVKQVFINATNRTGFQGFSQGIELFPNGTGDSNLIFYNTSTGITSSNLVSRIKNANLGVFDPLTTRGYVDDQINSLRSHYYFGAFQNNATASGGTQNQINYVRGIPTVSSSFGFNGIANNGFQYTATRTALFQITTNFTPIVTSNDRTVYFTTYLNPNLLINPAGSHLVGSRCVNMVRTSISDTSSVSSTFVVQLNQSDIIRCFCQNVENNDSVTVVDFAITIREII